MNSKIKKGLGRGLSSLIGETKVESKTNKLPLSDISPNKFQPRKNFDEENLEDLNRLYPRNLPKVITAPERLTPGITANAWKIPIKKASLKSNSLGCNNCEKSGNKFNKICIVENISDQWTIENSNIYQGYYHILGGTISSSNGSSKQDLLLESLIKRIKEEKIEEVILATSATVEGQTTAFYIQDSLKDTNVKISKLAQGLPIGGEIENLDDGTLVSAFKNRKKI